MICRELCFEVEEEVDLSGLIAYLQSLSEKSGCKVEVVLNVKSGRVKVRSCCLRSRRVIKAIRDKAIAVSGLRKSRCVLPKRWSGTLKLFYIKDRQLCIGKELDTGAPFCLPSKALRRHALIVGSTGSGKSTTAKRIAEELGENLLILDWHGEYGDLNFEVVNCVSFDKLREMGKLELIDSLAVSLGLSDSQYYLLMKTVQLLWNQKRDFGIDDIIHYLKSVEEVSRWIRESKYALLKRLEMLRTPEPCDVSIESLLKMASRGVVLDMTGLATEYAKRFVANALVSYAFTKSKSRKLKRLYVFLEEAHNVAPKSSDISIIDKAFMEGRKYGLHLVAITQSPKRLSENLVRNTATKIIHGMKEVEDAKYIANSIGYPDLWKDIIELDVGQAIIYFKRPIKVHVEGSTRERIPPTPRRDDQDIEASHKTRPSELVRASLQ